MQIFPKEIIENTSEVHQFKNSTKSKAIYLIILLTLLGVLVSLPFLSVVIYSSSRGIIKPDKERVTLNIINSGRILFSNAINNQRVEKGDTLLVIDNNGIDDRLDLSAYQMNEASLFIVDLTALLESRIVGSTELLSSKYKRKFLQYSQELRELGTRYEKAKRDFNRHKILFDKGVISTSEFENKQFDFDLTSSDIYQFKKQQQNLWQADLTLYENQLKELNSSKDQLIKSKNQFVVTAPTNGSLINIQAQELGSFVSTGTRLGEISPETDLLVECYVNPSDIGLIKESSNITFQIDAYNYNQWGLATGQILEIGKDIELINNQPIFKVRCKINEKYLQLKNGFKGNLKKGMALNANFELTERSVYDLLYDKMDDWLNPSRHKNINLKL